jgi:hypothetical protein
MGSRALTALILAVVMAVVAAGLTDVVNILECEIQEFGVAGIIHG